jgi:hypothetical protein
MDTLSTTMMTSGNKGAGKGGIPQTSLTHLVLLLNPCIMLHAADSYAYVV